jgi:uncharacterized protein (TIGR02246 family)
MLKNIIYSFFLLLVLSACQKEAKVDPNPTALDSNDIQVIKGIINEYVEAYNKHDARKMASLWAPDGDLLSAWGDLAISRGDVEKLIQKQVAGNLRNAKIEESIEYIKLISPNVALVDVNRVITGAERESVGQLPPYLNHAFYVFIKNNGKWEIIAFRVYFTVKE